METKDIKLPLRYTSHRQIVDAAGGLVIQVYSGACGIEVADQLQELVPVACNSHALLVEAAQAARAVFEAQKWRPTSTDPESVALRKLIEALAAAGVA
ncbi:MULTISPECIES: hypothetical protein [unclassified Massilia]|uniref:hypothetical protein n=1 Tax=unclassified Massilia TaxID=2609279 RepID=UPI00177ABCCC|nr:MULTISPECIES: hypothetical protein [unclassified Massilia]MBD8531520.1 hypothetical protein [Massilia sp. CFBP 13647]MBD8673684.1 hypothetical protein [Massilia sp. CFBP 13721]